MNTWQSLSLDEACRRAAARGLDPDATRLLLSRCGTPEAQADLRLTITVQHGGGPFSHTPTPSFVLQTLAWGLFATLPEDAHDDAPLLRRFPAALQGYLLIGPEAACFAFHVAHIEWSGNEDFVDDCCELDVLIPHEFVAPLEAARAWESLAYDEATKDRLQTDFPSTCPAARYRHVAVLDLDPSNESPVGCVIAPNEQFAVVEMRERGILVLGLPDLAVLGEAPGMYPRVAIAPDSSRFACLWCEEERLELRGPTGELRETLEQTPPNLDGVAYLADGRLVASVFDRSEHCTRTRVLAPEDGRALQVLLDHGDELSHTLRCSPNGRHVAELRENGDLRVWDLPGGRSWAHQAPPSVRDAGFTTDGRLFTLEGDGEFTERDPTDGSVVSRHAFLGMGSGAVAWAPSGDFVVFSSTTVNSCHPFVLWERLPDFRTIRVLRQFSPPAPAPDVGPIVFSATGRFLVLVAGNRTVHLYERGA